MNAQQAWKVWYRSSHKKRYNMRECRDEMNMVRREAALERIIARQAERIAELEAAYQRAWYESWK